MNNNNISCPGGVNTQTGTAVLQRYAGVAITDCGKINDVPEKLGSHAGSFVVPIWNSHQGEVAAAEYVWNLIEKAKIKICDIWAKRIEFWFVRRIEAEATYGKIGSVIVAETQCSIFLASQNAKLIPRDLTTIAHDEYRNGAEWDGVLVAPGQGVDEEGYEVASEQTANGNNFTTFVNLCDSQIKADGDPSYWLSGVSMRPLDVGLGEAEQSFFEKLVESADSLDALPKLIFVFKRTSKVGLLFEGARLSRGDLLDAEEMEQGNISIYEDAGEMSRLYTEELKFLFAQEFPDLVKEDFILHKGVKTCLFACPPLGIYTHGYEIDAVEPVVRFYISKHFELIDNGADCSADQSAFFERNKTAWQKRQSEFMQFKEI